MSTNDQTNGPSRGELPDEPSAIARWLEPSPPLPVDDVERPPAPRASKKPERLPPESPAEPVEHERPETESIASET
jgi:hypothetical protein